MRLIAKKSLRYAGHRCEPGEAFEAIARDAKILCAIGKAEPADEVTPVDVPAEIPEPEPAAPPRRQYRRRDLVAEDA